MSNIGCDKLTDDEIKNIEKFGWYIATGESA